MIHIPILRHGRPYESVESVEILHHATGEPVARVSQANSGMIVRDVDRMAIDALEPFSMAELIAATRRAGDIFIDGSLPIGEQMQSFDDYVRCLSATTGMPVAYCRNNARKIHRVFTEIDVVLAGLTRGFNLSILDRGFGDDDGRTLSFHRSARVFGAVLPSNSPGVHSLWLPAIAMKTPVVLKPGREEPWTPWRIIQSFIAAGLPPEAFGFYPTDHGGAAELLRVADRSMLFGDASTTAAWKDDPRVELHGPGYSKIILGEDAAADWEKHLDVIVSSIAANSGRSCINASGVWTPRNGKRIAEALAARLAKVQALPADDPNAEIAAFANPKMAEMISQSIDEQLRTPGAMDLTEQLRGSSRLVRRGRCAWLLPTIVQCEAGACEEDSAKRPSQAMRASAVGHDEAGKKYDETATMHPLANREYLFPFAAVIESPAEELPHAIGPTLVATAITDDKRLIAALMDSPNIDRLNIGPIPTWQLAWDQPHEGNLFEHLYRRRAFQIGAVA